MQGNGTLEYSIDIITKPNCNIVHECPYLKYLITDEKHIQLKLIFKR